MELSDWLAPLLGGFGGVLLGLAARIGRFCSLGAIEDATFGAGTTRLATWGLAIAMAILGTSLLGFFGVVPIAEVFYLSNPVPIVSTVLGGLAFGLGMALVGTCGFGALARLGGGDLSGLVVTMVIGMTSYVSTSGFIGIFRARFAAGSETELSQSGIAHAIGATSGVSGGVIAVAIGLIFLAVMLFRLHGERSALVWGGTVGSVIVMGWATTAWLHRENFGETGLHSYNFVRPVGDTMIYAMTSTGTAFSFGVASVLGVLVGAVIGAVTKREFRWEACDDARTLKRHILGAALMGIGGVFSLGCTVGQGLSAASVLAISAPIAILSIMAGAWCGLQWLVNGSVLEPLSDLFKRQ